MDKLNTFTSTGCKLIGHPDLLQVIKKEHKCWPVSLQVAPTSMCNLNCVFCSNVNRDKHENLDLDEIQGLIYRLSEIGLRTVEWTGGGEPLMWEPLMKAIHFVDGVGLDQGCITNGTLLSKMDPSFFEIMKWVRVSMNCLDYVEEVNIPELKGTLGFSYVINDNSTQDSLRRLFEHTDSYQPAYVRIVPNCQCSSEQQEKNNEKFSKMVKGWGEPYFYQPKIFSKPQRCWWGNLKPFLLHDGYIYPCSSVVLNEDSERSFHEKYRWCHMKDFINKYGKEMESFENEGCLHCVFTGQNDMVDSLLNSQDMEDFL